MKNTGVRVFEEVLEAKPETKQPVEKTIQSVKSSPVKEREQELLEKKALEALNEEANAKNPLRRSRITNTGFNAAKKKYKRIVQASTIGGVGWFAAFTLPIVIRGADDSAFVFVAIPMLCLSFAALYFIGIAWGGSEVKRFDKKWASKIFYARESENMIKPYIVETSSKKNWDSMSRVYASETALELLEHIQNEFTGKITEETVDILASYEEDAARIIASELSSGAEFSKRSIETIKKLYTKHIATGKFISVANKFKLKIIASPENDLDV